MKFFNVFSEVFDLPKFYPFVLNYQTCKIIFIIITSPSPQNDFKDIISVISQGNQSS